MTRKILDYLVPIALFYMVMETIKVVSNQGTAARISAHLGMLHELLQLNPDDHQVTWEDGSIATIGEAITYYVDQLIDELRE